MHISDIIQGFSRLKIYVLGDLMLDRYLFGEVKRISPEAPVQVLKVSAEKVSPGGAANVANNVKSLGASVAVFGVTGGDRNGETLIDLLTRIGIDTKGIVFDSGRPTTTKTRLIAESQQIARVDVEETALISNEVKNRIMEKITNSIEEDPPHGIIISDYAKGIIREDLSKEVIDLARRKEIFVCVDPKGRDFTKYRGASAVTPNQKETELVCGFPIEDEESLRKAADILIKQTDADGVLITRGKNGISFYIKGKGDIKTVSSEAREIFDVTGAGDTVTSVFTLSYILSKSWEDSVKIANKAAGIVVGRIGTVTVSPRELEERFKSERRPPDKKILEREILSVTLSRLRAEGKRIVFTNGCFDLFHMGHLQLLREAKKLGDVLVVGINSEESVRRIKGEGRPFIPENDRASIVSALDCVDYVVIFSEDTPLELIKSLKPDILVKGGDYSPETVVGREIVEGYGGKVCIIPLLKGISTSLLVDKIRRKG
jgi:D-beta-D-heptose 7-phosphate kinase/D-beta-D-heptose 1-phosphate adenosyltransferase